MQWMDLTDELRLMLEPLVGEMPRRSDGRVTPRKEGTPCDTQ
jgi:hypothetical protein